MFETIFFAINTDKTNSGCEGCSHLQLESDGCDSVYVRILSVRQECGSPFIVHLWGLLN